MQLIETYRYRGNGPRVSRMTVAMLLLWTMVSACDRAVTPIALENAVAEAIVHRTGEPGCIQGGHLTVELYGSIRASIDWRPDALACAGMPRPDNEGARLRMSGPLGAGEEVRTLAFILGLPDLEIGQTASELPTNVTLIEEGTGRFFGTLDTDGCWTDVASQEPAGGDNDQVYRIEGTLFCVSPLAELNGNSSVTFTELRFAGRLNWEQPQ